MGICHNGGKRKGSACIYLPDYHIDIFEFLELRKNSGSESMRARDLFYALWISDLFMDRVQKDEMWSLFCPNITKGLNDVYGKEFEELYVKYEREEKYFKQIRARELWQAIYISWAEVGMPFILFKDSVNRKTNQKNLGTTRSSNLCVSGDTMILTDKGQYPIEELENQDINIWNGKEWSNVSIRKTGEHQNLLCVKFSNGVELQCTPEHKFYIQPSYHSKKFVEVKAKDLVEGSKLIKWNLPYWVDGNEDEDINYPYTHVFFCG